MIESDHAALSDEPAPVEEASTPSAPAPAGVDAEADALPDHLRVLLDSLIAKVEAAPNEIDVDLVRRAFHYANAHHAGQKRKSGEDFVVHPVEVAMLVTDLMLDTDSIVAALLHDVVEDTEVSAAEVSELFGEGVAHLVEGVTKLSRI